MVRVVLLVSLLVTLLGAQDFKVIGYYMQFRPTPTEEKLAGLTHLIFTGLTVNSDATLDTTRMTNLDNVNAVAKKVDTKVLVMLGGWGQSFGFPDVAADSSLREAFAENLTNFCVGRGVQGADIDWEFPADDEMDGYEKMVAAVRRKFDEHGLILTAAMGGDKGGKFTPKTYEYLHWVNLMTYDRGWAKDGSPMPEPHSPKNQVDRLPQWHNSYGIPKEKLVLGLPFYGRNSMKWSEAKAYSELYTTYNPTPDQDSVGGFNYNGPHMISYKTNYTKKNGYGGVMIWEIEHDLVITHEHSLLKTINETADTTLVDTGDGDSTIVDPDKYDGFKVVGYFPLNGKMKDMDEVDFSVLTHIIGAFIFSDEKGELHYPGWKYVEGKTAEEAEEEMLDSMIARAKRTGVAPMIALGTTANGWKMTEDAAARTNFIKNVKALVIEKGLAGVDLDLEGGDNPEGYGLLAAELNDSLGDEYLLSSAVTANKASLDNWNDLLIESLDWINVMVYDIRVWNGSDVANQSLFEDQVKAAGFWEERGLEKKQIVFGVPFYSRGWNYDTSKPYLVDVCWAPDHSKDSSEWNWNSISTFGYEMMLRKFDLNDNQDSVLVTPEDEMWIEDGWTGYRGTANGVLFYNGPDMIARKTKWAIDSGYGGMMVWELTSDIATDEEQSLLGRLVKTIKSQVSVVESVDALGATSDISAIISRDQLSLSLKQGHYQVSLLDLRGRQVSQLADRTFNTGVHQLSLSNNSFASGLYLLRITSAHSRESTQRIILQK